MKSPKVTKRNSLMSNYENAINGPFNTGWLAGLSELAGVLEDRCELILKHANGVVRQLELLSKKSPSRSRSEAEKMQRQFRKLAKFRIAMEESTYCDAYDLNTVAYDLAFHMCKQHRRLASMNGSALDLKAFPEPRPTLFD